MITKKALMVNGIKKLDSRLIRILLIAAVSLLVAAVLVAVARPETQPPHDFDSCLVMSGAEVSPSRSECTYGGKSFTKDHSDSTRNAADTYVGLPEDRALQMATKTGQTARVVERDGEPVPVTMDYMPGRLNFTVTDGKVTQVDIEGQAD